MRWSPGSWTSGSWSARFPGGRPNLNDSHRENLLEATRANVSEERLRVLHREIINSIARRSNTRSEVTVEVLQERLDTGDSKVMILTLRLVDECLKGCEDGPLRGLVAEKLLGKVGDIALSRVNPKRSGGLQDFALRFLGEWATTPTISSKYPRYREVYTRVRESSATSAKGDEQGYPLDNSEFIKFMRTQRNVFDQLNGVQKVPVSDERLVAVRDSVARGYPRLRRIAEDSSSRVSATDRNRAITSLHALDDMLKRFPDYVAPSGTPRTSGQSQSSSPQAPSGAGGTYGTAKKPEYPALSTGMVPPPPDYPAPASPGLPMRPAVTPPTSSSGYSINGQLFFPIVRVNNSGQGRDADMSMGQGESDLQADTEAMLKASHRMLLSLSLNPDLVGKQTHRRWEAEARVERQSQLSQQPPPYHAQGHPHRFQQTDNYWQYHTTHGAVQPAMHPQPPPQYMTSIYPYPRTGVAFGAPVAGPSGAPGMYSTMGQGMLAPPPYSPYDEKSRGSRAVTKEGSLVDRRPAHRRSKSSDLIGSASRDAAWSVARDMAALNGENGRAENAVK